MHVHHAFLYISLPSLHNYDVKWPNLKFFEDGNAKAINSTISVWTGVRSPLFSSNKNSLLLSNRATWDNREMGWKDAESIFSVTFSWTLPLSDRKVPIIVLPHLVNGKIRRTIQLSYSFTLTLMMRTAQGAFETSAVTITRDTVTLETVTIETVTMDTVYTVNNRPMQDHSHMNNHVQNTYGISWKTPTVLTHQITEESEVFFHGEHLWL